ncbi:hypothetical protein [Pseudogulbenkiania subflava]|uniref:Uncharacterized protein n=1 Tax=Pseudogulbenkiania subflava DSM 22618 TaxID=1123014 RepID=A0A1Y6C2T5_9NEIS|nr:hypothetical protein [Pseudogulbenkiania subflava]SMF38841.1 hypothetical protein SAMN02745746_02937 [Pseudogulbenkiania subflava DSM 22618]
MITLNLWAAWLGIAAGLLSGVTLGLFFHRDTWLGGYASWPRRLLRLGHISCFGVAFLNLAFAATVRLTGELPHGQLASWLLVIGALTMPLVCALAAWKKPLRHLFFIPVFALLGAAAAVIGGGFAS